MLYLELGNRSGSEVEFLPHA